MRRNATEYAALFPAMDFSLLSRYTLTRLNARFIIFQQGDTMNPGTLYICATPIGNLEDITYRVLRCLREVDLIAAEDTRNSIRLLNHFEIKTPMTAYHEYNKYDKARYLVQELLNGKSIAIITDAGTPCISDPGEELVRQAAEANVPVTSLPGPAACITALTLSALPTRRFAFEAFLPADKKERQEILAELARETRTMIVYEAPHHLRKTLAELTEVLGADRRISLCRELTKTHEESLRTTLGMLSRNTRQRSPGENMFSSSRARAGKASGRRPSGTGRRCPSRSTCSIILSRACRRRMP